MGSYYYLGAQLPYLVYGQSPPMRSVDFRELALKHMSAAEAELLDQCTLDPDPPEIIDEDASEDSSAAAINAAGLSADEDPSAAGDSAVSYADPPPKTSSPLINRWREWERALRLNLAKDRAIKLRRMETINAPESPNDVINVAKNALQIESPLEAELFLDKARWDAIDSFQGVEVFSDNAMYAYLLKLLLMERRELFNAEEGFTEYKELYKAILSSQAPGFSAEA